MLSGVLPLRQVGQNLHEAGERSEEHTSELQSRLHLVCRLLLEKKKATAAGRRLRWLHAKPACVGRAAAAPPATRCSVCSTACSFWTPSSSPIRAPRAQRPP